MTLDEIYTEWEKDRVIDDVRIDHSVKIIPNLHGKYLKEYSQYKIRLKNEEMKLKRLMRDKFEYYSGKMTKEKMDQLGWDYDPFGGLKIMKSDMHYYYESDDDLQSQQARIEYYKVVIETLKEIMDQLKWRSQSLKTILDHQKFVSGA